MNFDKFEKLENRLLERIEISATFDVSHSSFNRREAATLVAKEAKFNPDSVYTIKLSHRSGLKKVNGLFYIYKDENLAKKYLPTYILNRKKPVEKPAEEAKAKEKPAEEAKAKEKPTEESETATKKE